MPLDESSDRELDNAGISLLNERRDAKIIGDIEKTGKTEGETVPPTNGTAAWTRATKVGCFKVGICRNSGFESVRQL